MEAQSRNRRAAIGDAARAFAVSRALLWTVGVGAVLILGDRAASSAYFDPSGATVPFGRLGDVLVAPGIRWDSPWYLAIAGHGYGPERAAFFPLYPGLLALVTSSVRAAIVAGIAISSACSLGALYLIHRLVSLDRGLEVARATVWIICALPFALVLSAVYTEGLFLLLAAGAIYAARLGRWPAAALCVAAAGATRSSGVLLVVPALAVMLYGPRADRPAAAARSGWRPAYRLGREALWLLLAPAGLLASIVYLGVVRGDPLAAIHAQSHWDRVLIPLGAIPLGIWHALSGLADIIPPIAVGPPRSLDLAQPFWAAVLNVALAGFLALAGWLTLAVARRLSVAEAAYALSALALPLSAPSADYPLLSLPRYMLVIFPFWTMLAIWALERGILRRVLLASSAVSVLTMVLFVGWLSPP